MPTRVCPIIGCSAEVTAENGVYTCPAHKRPAIKRYEGGFTYYAATYGPRFGDGTTVVSLVHGKAEQAAEQSAEWHRLNDWQDTEEGEHPESPCGEYGCPWCDIAWTCESTHSAKDLFNAAELREHRHALRQGQVICLSR